MTQSNPTSEYSDPIEWLRSEYLKRRSKNARYSLRSFAKLLNANSGRVSQLLNRKRVLTLQAGQKFCEKLSLSRSEEKKVLEMILKSKPVLSTTLQKQPFTNLDDDKFALIADWYHFAILNLTSVTGFKSDAAWIAKRLGISVVEVQDAVERLERLGLVSKEQGRLKRTVSQVLTTDDVPSRALRLSHQQSLEQAIEALETVDINVRDITSMTFAMNRNNFSKAKKLVRNFYKEISELAKSKSTNEVYNLNIQLIPLTKEISNGKNQKLS
ncbi:MAG: DUF4423 domain-containing protein [Oligoflexales bacterium]|nr:DUF4423 domain-containing protein [Oligoflexales bacterium]